MKDVLIKITGTQGLDGDTDSVDELFVGAGVHNPAGLSVTQYVDGAGFAAGLFPAAVGLTEQVIFADSGEFQAVLSLCADGVML